MKTHKKIIAGILLGLGSFSVQAQQAPMYTHYMYNTLSVNPAYAGSREALTITALHRSQWVGFSGAPMTQTLTMHSPVASEHIGLGLSFTNDRIGPVNNTSIFGSFAYIMQLTKKSKLALGLSGGANILQADLEALDLESESDPVFVNVSNRATANFGFGAYYSMKRFYAGISAPNLLENSYSTVTLNNGNQSLAKEDRHYFFIAGGLIDLSPNVAFKPTTLIKYTPNAPSQIDLTASFVLRQRLLLGAMYRSGDAVGALVGFDLSQQFHVGYSFDWSYGVRTFKYNQGSHEIVLRYDFIFPGRKQIDSPRYF
ncbi:MAG: type IX secretion system membrane protein PorP/SprF [Bacteroidota bacterium]